MVLDDYAVMTSRQLRLMTWISEYYMCCIGEVMRAALPAGLKVETETFVEANPDFDPTIPPGITDERQLLLWQALCSKGKMTSKSLSKATGIEHTESLLDELLKAGAVMISERLVERFRPRKQFMVVPIIGDGDRRQDVRRMFDVVSKAPVQQRILAALLKLSGAIGGDEVRPVARQSLLQAADVTTPASLTALETK